MIKFSEICMLSHMFETCDGVGGGVYVLRWRNYALRLYGRPVVEWER